MTGAADRPITAFLIAGEESGDQLGADLMQALRERCGDSIRFIGVGGERMSRHGLKSLFPMEEIAFHGVTAIIANLPRILSRMRKTAQQVLAADPDILIIIDCPGFNLGVARRVRRSRPSIAIVEYVSPTVWVWRPDRARRIAPFIDRILAILPFEPDVHRRLGGPPCVYVGHPLIERLDTLRPAPGERAPIEAERKTLLVLPGSRRNEIKRLMRPFGEAVARIAAASGPLDIILPAVKRFAPEIRAAVANWPVKPLVVEGEAEKLAAFRRGNAALAASGTVTLELALAGVPMAVAYRVDPLVKPFKYVLSRINSFVLPNIITGGNAIPEFLDDQATPERLAAAILPLLKDSPERRAQFADFARLEALMKLSSGTPSGAAADHVLEMVRSPRSGERSVAVPSGQRRLETGT